MCVGGSSLSRLVEIVCLIPSAPCFLTCAKLKIYILIDVGKSIP